MNRINAVIAPHRQPAPPAPVPRPLLVTGIAGVAGYNAFRYFRARFGDEVVGIRQSSLWPLRGPGIVGCDLEDAEAIDRLWDQYRFRSLLNCAGSCRLKSCERDPQMAHRVNVQGAANLMRAAVRHAARVVHLSIDLVFAGRAGGAYREEEPPDPVTVYGAKMVEAEGIVARRCPAACILRISLPMGISFNGHAGAIDWIASRFKKGKPATLYFDEVRTPHFTDCLNELFEHLLANQLAGLFHAGGPRTLSLYEIAQIVNVVGGYDPQLLNGCPRIAAGPMPPRAGNVTLDTSKLTAALGYQPFAPWPLDEGLVPTDRQWHCQRPARPGGEGSIHRHLYTRGEGTANPSTGPPKSFV